MGAPTTTCETPADRNTRLTAVVDETLDVLIKALVDADQEAWVHHVFDAYKHADDVRLMRILTALALMGRAVIDSNTKNKARNTKIEAIEQRCAAIDAHHAQLDVQVKALEERPSLTYQGIWKSQRYPRGAATTHQGSLWIAERDTDGQPGSGAPAVTGWRLAVKKGQDGRDRA